MGRQKIWTDSRVDKLKQMYPTESWENLLKEFVECKTKQRLIRQASSLGFKREVASSKRASNTKHDDFLFTGWSERSAYILGYLEADGYIQKRNSKYTPSVSITFCTSNKDLEYLKKLKEWVGFQGPILTRNHHLSNGKTYQTNAFIVCSRSWKDFLEKNLRKGKIPNDIPSNLIHHYIRGYFDGDGSVYFQENSTFVNFVSSSETLLEEIKEKIREGIQYKNEGKMVTRIKHNSNKCWSFTIAKQNLVQRFAEWLYKDSSYFLDRKKIRFNYILQRIFI